MQPAAIIALILFALKEAPEIMQLIGSLLKIVTPDDVDAKIDVFNREAAIRLNTLLAAAKSTARAVQAVNFGDDLTQNEINNRKFEDVKRAIKQLSVELQHELSDGEADTIAQNGWALEMRSVPILVPEQ